MHIQAPPLAPVPGTRERLVAAMVDALRCRGYHGIGLVELLAQAGAPKGVLYHHFPGGKSALAVAAIAATAQRILESLEKLLAVHAQAADALAAWIDAATRQLEKSGFERGCPLATIALESTADDRPLRAALAAAFTAIRGRIADALVADGVAAAEARALAALIVSAYEGSLMQARVEGHAGPVRDASRSLLALLAARKTPARRRTPRPASR